VWILTPRATRVAGLQIVPAGMAAGADALVLTDTPAFGTGLHATTALCLEVLAEIVTTDRPDRVLDVGTGSGVLALAALKLGVPRATAIDIDPAALRAAADNARLNGLDARIDLAFGGPDAVEGAWPLVLANVVAAPLIEMAAVLVRRAGHHASLVLSGIPEGVDRQVAAGAGEDPLEQGRHRLHRHARPRGGNDAGDQ